MDPGRKGFLAGRITAIDATTDEIVIQHRLPTEEARTE